MIRSFDHLCNSKRINATSEVSTILVLFLTAITAIGWEDIRMLDEALYMRQGLISRLPFEIDWTWGPTYSDI